MNDKDHGAGGSYAITADGEKKLVHRTAETAPPGEKAKDEAPADAGVLESGPDAAATGPQGKQPAAPKK